MLSDKRKAAMIVSCKSIFLLSSKRRCCVQHTGPNVLSICALETSPVHLEKLERAGSIITLKTKNTAYGMNSTYHFIVPCSTRHGININRLSAQSQ
jgi:hypothetical protein